MAFSKTEVERLLAVAGDAHVGASAQQRFGAAAPALRALVPHSAVSLGVFTAPGKDVIALPAGHELYLENLGMEHVVEYARSYGQRDPVLRAALARLGQPVRVSDHLGATHDYARDLLPRMGVRWGVFCALPLEDGRIFSLRLWREGHRENFSARDSRLAALAAAAIARGIRECARADAHLTARERAVVEGVARGLSNARIASELAVSPETVKLHLKHVFRKLGVATRAGLAARWVAGPLA